MKNLMFVLFFLVPQTILFNIHPIEGYNYDQEETPSYFLIADGHFPFRNCNRYDCYKIDTAIFSNSSNEWRINSNYSDTNDLYFLPYGFKSFKVKKRDYFLKEKEEKTLYFLIEDSLYNQDKVDGIYENVIHNMDLLMSSHYYNYTFEYAGAEAIPFNDNIYHHRMDSINTNHFCHDVDVFVVCHNLDSSYNDINAISDDGIIMGKGQSIYTNFLLLTHELYHIDLKNESHINTVYDNCLKNVLNSNDNFCNFLIEAKQVISLIENDSTTISSSKITFPVIDSCYGECTIFLKDSILTKVLEILTKFNISNKDVDNINNEELGVFLRYYLKYKSTDVFNKNKRQLHNIMNSKVLQKVFFKSALDKTNKKERENFENQRVKGYLDLIDDNTRFVLTQKIIKIKPKYQKYLKKSKIELNILYDLL